MDLSEPSHAPSTAGFPLRRAVATALLLTSAAVLQPAIAQSSESGEMPTHAVSSPSLDLYRADLDLALRLSSPAADLLARDVHDARQALTSARRGLSAVGSFSPGAEHERDLTTGTGSWEVELELEMTGTYRFDRTRLLRAEIALTRADVRWRAQRRSDAERAMLALSGARLSARDVEDARVDAERSAAELATALAQAHPPREVEDLRIVAELAVVDLERALLQHRDEDEALIELGLSMATTELLSTGPARTGHGQTGGQTDHDAWLVETPAPLLEFADLSSPRPAPELRLLSLELELAKHELTLAPFEVVRELELYGGYEVRGFGAGSRLALVGGVPVAEASLGWDLGADDHVFTVGVGATFRLSDTSSAEWTVAQRDVTDARAALADHVATWPGLERRRFSLAELAYREFSLELRAQDLAESELAELVAAAAEERQLITARNAVRRAQDVSERAWQRYVRALGDYLDVIDVVLKPE